MAGEWRETTLGQLTDFLSGGTPSKSAPQYWGGSIPWVSAKDMKRFHLDDTEDHVTEDGVANGTKLVPSGTVLLLARGMTLLNDIPICVANRAMTFNQDVKALRPKPEVRIDFLPYLLLGNKERLLSLVDLAGHGTGRLNSDELKALDVMLPPEPEQRAIARILGTLDDKIELNRRMNETLEALAQALFKSWFVDFDPVRAKAEGGDSGLPRTVTDLFPDRFDDSELGEIPAGWSTKTIEEIAERVGMGPFGSSIKVETFCSEGVPVISGQHLRGFMMEDNTFNHISVEHAERLKNANVTRGDVVFTHAGNIGQVAYIPENSQFQRYVISQRQFFMRCDSSQVTPSFVALYFRSPEGQHRLLANASSSGVPSIARPVTYLRSIQLVVPPKLIIDVFEKVIRPMLLQFRCNLDEAHTRASLRDMLLPKLLSGKIRVNGRENIVEAIA